MKSTLLCATALALTLAAPAYAARGDHDDNSGGAAAAAPAHPQGGGAAAGGGHGDHSGGGGSHGGAAAGAGHPAGAAGAGHAAGAAGAGHAAGATGGAATHHDNNTGAGTENGQGTNLFTGGTQRDRFRPGNTNTGGTNNTGGANNTRGGDNNRGGGANNAGHGGNNTNGLHDNGWNNGTNNFDRAGHGTRNRNPAFNAMRRAVNASHHYHAGSYHRPRGWYAHRWTFGDVLPALFFTRDYWLADYEDYDLPYPPPGTTWVRYGNDALLIDEDTGEVIQVQYGIFY